MGQKLISESEIFLPIRVLGSPPLLAETPASGALLSFTWIAIILHIPAIVWLGQLQR
jgi:hypothetical protein